MEKVSVERLQDDDPLAFDVSVGETGDESSHRVTLDPSQFERLRRPDESAEEFVRRCFEFLLAREPEESILSSFDVSVISRYFPEFEDEIAR